MAKRKYQVNRRNGNGIGISNENSTTNEFSIEKKFNRGKKAASMPFELKPAYNSRLSWAQNWIFAWNVLVAVCNWKKNWVKSGEKKLCWKEIAAGCPTQTLTISNYFIAKRLTAIHWIVNGVNQTSKQINKKKCAFNCFAAECRFNKSKSENNTK